MTGVGLTERHVWTVLVGVVRVTGNVLHMATRIDGCNVWRHRGIR